VLGERWEANTLIATRVRIIAVAPLFVKQNCRGAATRLDSYKRFVKNSRRDNPVTERPKGALKKGHSFRFCYVYPKYSPDTHKYGKFPSR
jgi:hypothetical protein